jgi:hypothetical protein
MLLLAASALLVTDCIEGQWYRTDTAAQLHVIKPRSGTTKEVLIVFPGYIMPGDLLSRAFAPYLPGDEAMIVVQYAQRDVDLAQIYQLVTAEVHRLHPKRLRIYGASMGGMCARDFLTRYEHQGAPFGKVVLVLDTSPSISGDIKLPRILFDLASWYRGGPLTSMIWAVISQGQDMPLTEPNADPDIVKQARHAGAWVGMPAITSQAAYIGRFSPLISGELVPVAARVVYLRGGPPGPDPLVDVGKAIAGWQRAFPALKVVSLTDRVARWHIPLIEWPGETMYAILGA